MMQIVITKEQAGLCVRQILKQQLTLSTKMLKYLKYQNNGITVNGEHCTVRYVLREGDVLEIMTEDREASEAIIPIDLPLEILYEDDDIVVPSKSAEMPTHPSHDHYRDTVANALAYRYARQGIPFVFRPINRLDRNTSGLLLVARNKYAAGRLTQAMQAGKIQKTYLAMLEGEMTQTSGIIDTCLHRTAASIIVREVCSPDTPDADNALTEYTVLSVKNGYTLVKAHPITGRTHQLRVHFASLGHPIVGDDLYGTPSPHIPRHALHASELIFPHPVTGAAMTVHASLPTDMQRLIDRIFGRKEPYIEKYGIENQA
ncbi:MAG: RluA family pseudouridine synthase [Clostridia bacterium]|nr:RluA family pseudouridine synthase [Clostridia bacterium]